MRSWGKITRGKAAMAALAVALGFTAWITVMGADSDRCREVKEQLRRQVERIKSLEVVYHLDTKTDLKPEQLLALAEFQNLLYLPNEEWREAYKGTKRFRRQILPEHVDHLGPVDKYGLTTPPEVNPKASELVRQNQKRMKEQYDRAVATLDAQAARGAPATRRDPSKRDLMERDVTRSYNGHSVWMRRPITEKLDEYQVWPTNARGNWFQPSPYLSATGLHIVEPTSDDPRVPKIQGMFQVEKWVKERSYELENKTDVIDGATCVVLKGSLNSLFEPAFLAGNLSDRIWLDRDHGFAVRKRELAKDGDILGRWENSSFKEVAPGIWLPMRCRHDRFALDAPPELNGKPALSEELRVDRLEVNQVPDDRFDMVPKEGDRIEDLRGKF